jgi:ATP-dependent helicase/DNAse subunit B
VFYIGLRGRAGSAKTRAETFEEPERTLRTAFRHEGRFNEAWLSSFDAGPSGEQFSTHCASKLDPAVFKQLMADVEAHLKRFGADILDGTVAIAPYRKDQRDTACLRCEFHGICRFDPWVEPYRALQPPPRRTASGKRRIA